MKLIHSISLRWGDGEVPSLLALALDSGALGSSHGCGWGEEGIGGETVRYIQFRRMGIR